MDRLTALLLFVLSLLGFDFGARSPMHRTHADGDDRLQSRATVEAGVARFECLRSASGRCHYLVLRRDCAAGTTGWVSQRPERFALSDGESRQITAARNVRLCVAIDEAERGCESSAAVTAR